MGAWERISLVRGDLTLGELADKLAAAHGRNTLVEEAGGKFTIAFDGAADLVDRWAAAVAADTEPGDRVVLATPNGYRQFLLTLAVAKAGRLPAPVNAQMSPAEIDHVVADSEATLVIRDAADLSTADQHGPAVAADPKDVAALFYTSGTTGKPKGSVHVHGGFTVKIAEEAAFQFDARPGDRLFWFADFGWIMGPWEIVGALANGATVCLYEGAPDVPDVDRLWRYLAEHQVTILGISPTLIRSLMTHGDDPVLAHDLSSLRILGSTGEPWNEEPYRWFAQVVGGGRCPVINISGGTEVGACFLSPHPVQAIQPMSLGGPALGMAVDVFDPDGRPIRGEVGELVCTKPWPGMTRGLWKAPERYLETYWSRWPDVWVHGDWALIDDGQWYLRGRSDDTIKIAGKRLGPAEVESALVGHPAVTEAAAVGLPHDVKGEALWCYVVLAPGVDAGDDLRDDLTAVVTAALGKSFRPSGLRFVTALPKTRSAKVVRRAIRATALGTDPGDLSSLEDPATLDAIRQAR